MLSGRLSCRSRLERSYAHPQTQSATAEAGLCGFMAAAIYFIAPCSARNLFEGFLRTNHNWRCQNSSYQR